MRKLIEDLQGIWKISSIVSNLDLPLIKRIFCRLEITHHIIRILMLSRAKGINNLILQKHKYNLRFYGISMREEDSESSEEDKEQEGQEEQEEHILCSIPSQIFTIDIESGQKKVAFINNVELYRN